MNTCSKNKNWLMPIAVVLFLFAVILTPYAVDRTYADRYDYPNHTLTYTAGTLTWDSATKVEKITGVAELNLFDSAYQNVHAENGEKVVAPGTEGKIFVRLENQEDHPITYITVFYRMKDEESLPVKLGMADDVAFTDTEIYPLPENVAREQVVRAVTGTVGARELQDFDLSWLWEYYESAEQDQTDSTIGNTAAWGTPGEIKAGLYIVVRENEECSNSHQENPNTSNPNELLPDDAYVYPEISRTGDSSNYTLYLILMLVSAVVLLLFLLDKRREKQ